MAVPRLAWGTGGLHAFYGLVARPGRGIAVAMSAQFESCVVGCGDFISSPDFCGKAGACWCRALRATSTNVPTVDVQYALPQYSQYYNFSAPQPLRLQLRLMRARRASARKFWSARHRARKRAGACDLSFFSLHQTTKAPKFPEGPKEILDLSFKRFPHVQKQGSPHVSLTRRHSA